MSYQLLLTIHIISATVLFGTGLGTAFHGLMAHRSGDLRAIAVVSRNVVRADWLFTTPAVIVQPVTGAWMARMMGFPLTTGWIAAALALYVVVGVCWLPVVWLQIRMSAMALAAEQARGALPPRYFVYARWWFALGWPAFVAMVGIFALMVFKPSF